MAPVLVVNGSSLNILPKGDLGKLNYDGLVLKLGDIVVRDFDGSKRMVHG